MSNFFNNPSAGENGSFDCMLDQGLSNRLTLLIGPDSVERSQALEDWLSRRDLTALSIKCPSSDDHVGCSARIVEAFTDAGIFEADEAEAEDDCQSRVVGLINHLAALRHDLVVVLLDYEPCERTNRAVSFLLEHLPHQIHIYVTSDDLPALSCIPRLRVRRQFQMIDTTAL